MQRFIGPSVAAAAQGHVVPVDKYLGELQKKLLAERQFPLLWDVVTAAERVISEHNEDSPEWVDELPF